MLALVEVPALVGPFGTAQVLLAASTASPGWRPQYVEVTHASRRLAVRTASRKSLLGKLETRLDKSGETAEVKLHDPDQWLTSCGDGDLELGENAAAVGQEIVQFREATPLGCGRFRIGELVRGLMGSEAAPHSKGEQFVLLDRASVQPINLPGSMAGEQVHAAALDRSAACALTLWRSKS